jgi:hypothetical protein
LVVTGWTWEPSALASTTQDAHKFNQVYFCAVSKEGLFPLNEEYKLFGTLDAAKGGNISWVSLNHAFQPATMKFGPIYDCEEYRCYDITVNLIPANTTRHRMFFGQAVETIAGPAPHEIFVYDNITKELATVLVRLATCVTGDTIPDVRYVQFSGSPKPPPPLGTCTIYSKTEAFAKTTDPGVQSGGRAVDPSEPSAVLYPSWPASSPWVTAVWILLLTAVWGGILDSLSHHYGWL